MQSESVLNCRSECSKVHPESSPLQYSSGCSWSGYIPQDATDRQFCTHVSNKNLLAVLLVVFCHSLTARYARLDVKPGDKNNYALTCRDLHPGNILVRRTDGGELNTKVAAETVRGQLQLILLDFGLAEELTPAVRHHFISFLHMIAAGRILAQKLAPVSLPSKIVVSLSHEA